MLSTVIGEACQGSQDRPFQALEATSYWTWPARIDWPAVEALMDLEFLKKNANAILIGPNGVGKTSLACNVAHQAVLHGHTVLFPTAGNILGDLAAIDSDSALRRRLRAYATPKRLVIDEIGPLSYTTRPADLLFKIINRRYEQ